MAIIATLPVFLLSNSIALNELLSKNYLELWDDEGTRQRDWEAWARVASHQRDSSRPNHVFSMRWQRFCDCSGVDLIGALDCVGADYLSVSNRRLYVREHAIFSRWQNLRSRMSLLPVKCWMQYKATLSRQNLMVHPYSPCMADYISRVGLNESHLHLHACQTPETSWQHALEHAAVFEHHELRHLRSSRDVYTSVHPELTPKKMAQRLRFARVLRGYLLAAGVSICPTEVRKALDAEYREFVRHPGDYDAVPPPETPYVSCLEGAEREIYFWFRLFELVGHTPQERASLLFYAHLYLLIQNEYLKLFRMNEQNRGFEAFQQKSHHRPQGPTLEQYYSDTFTKLLNTTCAREDTCVEVRVTPGIFCQKAQYLLQEWKNCCDRLGTHVPQLVIVIHFLKSKPKPRPSTNLEMVVDRFTEQRRHLRKECSRLVREVMRFSALSGARVGIDAAGNELDFPPEVMAPVFRKFERETGISYKTYHCGEDFYHLISGIRVVHDSVAFLGLEKGNRVGHATAIGIHPDVWRRDMPELLVMRQGDWLLDLIFAWRLLGEDNHEDVLRLEQTMLPIAMQIFEQPLGKEVDVHVHSLSAFYDARQLDPAAVERFLTSPEYPSWSPDPEEQRVIDYYQSRGVCGLKLLRYWTYSQLSQKRQLKRVEVRRDFLDPATLIVLQQKVQRFINSRNVVVETLPVSNLRISQYSDMRQHHLLRWLGIGKYAVPGDEQLTVCVGSDDPGIFVSDIKNEFYHIYANLMQEGLTPAECMTYIKRLNNAGRVYAFRELVIKYENFPFALWPTNEKNAAAAGESEPR